MVVGGEKRRDSVFNGLTNLPENTKFVMIHDAVRPLVNTDLVNEHINLIKTNEYGAVDTIVEITDNLIESTDDGFHSRIIPRKNVKLSLTPETFDYEILLECHKKRIDQNLDIPEIYDDASLGCSASIFPSPLRY